MLYLHHGHRKLTNTCCEYWRLAESGCVNTATQGRRLEYRKGDGLGDKSDKCYYRDRLIVEMIPKQFVGSTVKDGKA